MKERVKERERGVHRETEWSREGKGLVEGQKGAVRDRATDGNKARGRETKAYKRGTVLC